MSDHTNQPWRNPEEIKQEAEDEVHEEILTHFLIEDIKQSTKRVQALNELLKSINPIYKNLI